MDLISHNFYGSVEELLKIVATHFENNISDSSKWHSLLFKRMTQPVQGIRPSFLSMESYELLNALRAFRHFFRHAYGVSLDFHQLEANLERTLKLKPLLDQETEEFLCQLS
ncbi:ribonuclease toxin HepT-like protein [Synechocystis salina]|uniref:ribonuclease toxin HepT-like protein n=1 Tax=Synechocystis salina TaxID=945780 RepID=UPI00390842CA